jgi:ubiquinone/menaquinone biosynthesis C-methylase UbiE
MPRPTSAEQFNRQATHYNNQWNMWNESTLEWLIERARPKPTDRLLDVATGAGFTAVNFAPLVAEVTGLDVSEGMLAQARERARAAGRTNAVFQVGPAESLPFPDQSFDLVTSRVAPHHFLSVPKFAAEAYRVLRPGGRLLIADSALPDDVTPEVDAWQNELEVLREANPITMRAWIEKAGCRGEAAAEVERRFSNPPAEAARLFSITPLPDGDISFHWGRIVLSARKPG